MSEARITAGWIAITLGMSGCGSTLQEDKECAAASFYMAGYWRSVGRESDSLLALSAAMYYVGCASVHEPGFNREDAAKIAREKVLSHDDHQFQIAKKCLGRI